MGTGGGPSESVVYAAQLSARGYGYPLWDPNPTKDVDDDDEPQEVRIGDVGYLIDGAFRRLFNVALPPSDRANSAGMPQGSEPLMFNRRLVYARHNFLPPGPVCSSTVVMNSAEGSFGGGVNIANASAAYQFACQNNQGAVLLLKDHAHKEAVAPNRTFTSYLREHYDRWRHWAAAELGLDEKQDLLLVRGWVKTTQWELTAWADRITLHGVALQVTGANLAQAGVQAMHLQAESMGAPTMKVGPLGVDPSDMKPNQCVFLSYYKMRYRHGITWLPAKISAHAGYDKLPDHPDDEAGPTSSTGLMASSDVEMVPATDEFEDPVDILLEYILRYSEAEAAIACDGDLQDLFGDDEWPKDLREYLRERLPRIDVDDKRTGTLSIEDAIIRDHQRQEAHNEQIAAAHEAGTQTEHAAPPAAAAGAPPATAGDADADNGAGDGDHDGGDDERALDVDRFNEPKEVPDDLRRAALVLGKDLAVPRITEWPHHLLYDNTAEGGSVSALSMSKDARYIAASFEDTVIRVWELDTSLLRLRLMGHSDPVWSVSYSPTENDTLASASGDKTAIIWDTAYGDVLHKLQHSADLWSICFAPDGKSIATGAVDGVVRVWHVESGELLRSLSDSNGIVMFLSFSPDGKRLISGSDSTAHIWNPSSGEKLGEMNGHAGIVWSYLFSPDGSRLLTGAEDCTARVWDTENGEELVALRDHRGAVWALGWSPDGRRVATGSFDQVIYISDSFTGEKLRTLQQTPSAVVHTVMWSGDGDYFAAGSADGSVKIWEDATGEFVATLKGHKDKVKGIQFTPDGNRFVTWSDDGTVRVWSMADILRMYTTI